MEETLGRRIAANRKKLGMTQEILAEQLGVTAQAVSKWENDQSCPDIAMLPKLSSIFGVSIDILLGVKQEKKEGVEPVLSREQCNSNVELRKETTLGVALWLLMTGAIMMVMEVFPGGTFHMPLWKVAGLSALTIFGLFGIYPRFNLFRLGCGLWGGYCLYCGILHPAIYLNIRLWTSALLVILGASLLLDRIRGKHTFAGCLTVDTARKNVFEYQGRSFLCTTVFGDERRGVYLAELEGGEANVVFGNLGIDICDCSSVTENCCIVLRCAFGTLTLCVPRNIRLQCVNKNMFADVQEIGQPDGEAVQTIRLENNVCFGQIRIRYI